jgi:hypothetical protein
LTLLIIELGWGIAVLVAWVFHSMIDPVLTAGSVGISFYVFAEKTARDREEPTDLV